MGLPLPPTAERYECLEEALRLAAQMWAGDASPFHGKHYQLEGPISSPPPLSQPRPPILIGGMGERKTLRLVAQYADACNLFDIPDEGATIRRKLAVLAQHCEDVGRDYGSVEKTLSSRLEPGETADQFAARCEGLAALGIDHVVLITTGPWTREAVDVLCAARHMVDASRT
jgi:alkanesulfonate monooxygenase SsuD/methylene tetrahydromethanopterin reductase-like flavin-dependent oxidoreductase (luciferase family)